MLRRADGSYGCDQCNKTFNTSYGLKKHQKVCGLKCDFCSKSFNSVSGFGIHMESRHGVKNWRDKLGMATSLSRVSTACLGYFYIHFFTSIL